MVATNNDMKTKLEMVRSSLPNLVEIYMRTAKGKITEGEAKKQALENALVDGYALMNKVHEWLGILALKNHSVYPMREKIHTLFSRTKDCIDCIQLQQIND